MDTQVAALKAKLEAELQILTKELGTLGVQNPHAKEDWIATPEDTDVHETDINIVADRSEDWEERRATLDVLETRFNNINRALTKITNGTYGVCEIANEPIEADRLDANPAARTCKKHIDQEAELPTN